jgi:hypothetical protein
MKPFEFTIFKLGDVGLSRSRLLGQQLLLGFPIRLVLCGYIAFVLQNLWNWFAVKALNVSGIGFWSTCGLLIMINLFANTLREDNNEKWKGAYSLLEACVPEERREVVDEETRERIRMRWIHAASSAFEKIVGVTLAFFGGWIIHLLV